MSARRRAVLVIVVLAVALGSAAVALVVVPDHRDSGIRVTQLAAAAALVITALAVTAVLGAAGTPARAAFSDEGEQLDHVGLWVRLSGEGQRPFLVITAERENANFLVSRDDEQPQWVPKDRVEEWVVGPPPADRGRG